MLTTMKPTLDSVRRQTVSTSAMLADSYQSERRILESAQERLEHVEGRIAELRRTAVANEADGTEYLKMIDERGALFRVIAKAKHTLGGAS